MSTTAHADLMQSRSVLTRSLAEHGCEPFVEARGRGTNVKLLSEAVERVHEMEARLRALLKGGYGGDSTDLIHFGLSSRIEL